VSLQHPKLVKVQIRGQILRMTIKLKMRELKTNTTGKCTRTE